MTWLREAAGFLVLVALVLTGCQASSTIEAGTSTITQPSPAASPTVEVPTVEPTAVPTPPPLPTQPPLPTVPPIPSLPPTPTVSAEPDLFQELLDTEIRDLAALPIAGRDYEDYVDVSDLSGLVQVSAPSSWTDVDGRPWSFDDERVGNGLNVSTDIDAFRETWGDPGVFIGASQDLPFDDAESFLDDFSLDRSCDYAGRRDFHDGLYTGLADLWINCGPERALFVQIAAVPEDESYLIEVQLLAPTDRDLTAMVRVIDTFVAEVSEADAAASSFLDSLDEIRAVADLPTARSPYEEYVDIADDQGSITVTVPAEWIEVDGSSWTFDDEVAGRGLSASNDLETYRTGWGAPGVFLGASDELPFANPAEYLAEFWFGEVCTYEGEYGYDDGLYVGLIDVYVECGDEGSMFLKLAAAPEDGSYLISGEFVAVDDRDVDAIIMVVETFIANVD